MDIAEEKQAQRTSGKAARRALSPEQRAAANAALCARLWQLDAVQNAQTILLYAAFGGEAGLAGFAAEAARRGKVLAYPVCGENCFLTAAVPGPDGWETGLFKSGPRNLRKNGETVRTADFLRIGVPFTLAAVLTGSVYLWLVWGRAL